MHGSARRRSANCSAEQCSGAGPVHCGLYAKLQGWLGRDASKVMARHRTQCFIPDMGELVTEFQNLYIEQL